MIKLLLTSSLLLFSISTLATPLPQQPHIYVEGSATVEVEPDEMQFTLNISETSNEVVTAKSIVDTKSNKLIELCKKLGIETKDIATSTLRIYPQFKYNDGNREQTGTQVSRQIDIILRDLTDYSKVIKSFVDAKITQTVNTKLVLSEPNEATDKALSKALGDAKERASRLAKHQGAKLGKVYSISEFNSRKQEFYQLQVSRKIVGQSTYLAQDLISKRTEIDSLSGSVSNEPFEPGVIKATAQVFVVYLLN